MGRADLFLWETRAEYAIIVEVKNTDWIALERQGTVLRNLHRHARQMFAYVDGMVCLESLEDDRAPLIKVNLREINRTVGVVYPTTPSKPLKEYIEEYFDAEGIAVVWFDEPPPVGTPAWQAWEALNEDSFADEPSEGIRPPPER